MLKSELSELQYISGIALSGNRSPSLKNTIPVDQKHNFGNQLERDTAPRNVIHVKVVLKQ